MSARYLGDETAAAGFRLAGVDARVPGAGAEAAALREALGEASLVMLSAAFASRVPPGALEEALRCPAPPVVVVPDLAGRAPWPDPAAALARQLGLEA